MAVYMCRALGLSLLRAQLRPTGQERSWMARLWRAERLRYSVFHINLTVSGLQNRFLMVAFPRSTMPLLGSWRRSRRRLLWTATFQVRPLTGFCLTSPHASGRKNNPHFYGLKHPDGRSTLWWGPCMHLSSTQVTVTSATLLFEWELYHFILWVV